MPAQDLFRQIVSPNRYIIFYFYFKNSVPMDRMKYFLRNVRDFEQHGGVR